MTEAVGCCRLCPSRLSFVTRFQVEDPRSCRPAPDTTAPHLGAVRGRGVRSPRLPVKARPTCPPQQDGPTPSRRPPPGLGAAWSRPEVRGGLSGGFSLAVGLAGAGAASRTWGWCSRVGQRRECAKHRTRHKGRARGTSGAGRARAPRARAALPRPGSQAPLGGRAWRECVWGEGCPNVPVRSLGLEAGRGVHEATDTRGLASRSSCQLGDSLF